MCGSSWQCGPEDTQRWFWVLCLVFKCMWTDFVNHNRASFSVPSHLFCRFHTISELVKWRAEATFQIVHNPFPMPLLSTPIHAERGQKCNMLQNVTDREQCFCPVSTGFYFISRFVITSLNSLKRSSSFSPRYTTRQRMAIVLCVLQLYCAIFEKGKKEKLPKLIYSEWVTANNLHFNDNSK